MMQFDAFIVGIISLAFKLVILCLDHKWDIRIFTVPIPILQVNCNNVAVCRN